MKEQLIEFETAKLAKEKGFEEFSNKVYNQFGKLFIFNSGLLQNHERILAPTQSLLQKWLREEKDMNVWLKPHYGEVNGLITNNWSVYVDDFYGHHLITDYIYIHGYEEALEAGLIAALKLIKL